MKLYVDNNDGLGGVDYTAALLVEKPLTIERRRGAWTRCSGGLDVAGTGLPVPSRSARVLVTDDAGALLFEGFLAMNVHASETGATTAMTDDLPLFTALEAAWLTQGAPADVMSASTAAMHTLALADVALTFDGLQGRAVADLATDVTVSGELEAAAYVTELFRGDGSTQTFALSHAPFAAPGRGTLVSERFDDAVLSGRAWAKTDPGSSLSLGVGGLQMAGGTGYDGATTLRFAKPVEMGGTLMAESTGVALTTGSEGVLLGFYDAVVKEALCVAGVKVRGTGGARALVAVVRGMEQPVSYTFVDGHMYTLRVRLHCAETVRVAAKYTALVDGVPQTFGAEPVAAAVRVVMDVVDTGLASSTLPTVLFDGAIASSPVECIFAPVNSVSMVGSMGSVELRQQGSCWVVSTAADGVATTRREGVVGTGADYTVTPTGVLSFAPGRVPQPGELVVARYRRSKRAVARLRDAGADALRASLALPGLPAWSGHVVTPLARTSADCLAAAQALLALAAGSATGRSGHVEWMRVAADGGDPLPGDTLAVTTAEGTMLLPVHAVTLTDRNCVPEVLRYRARFGQGRAESCDFAVSESVAEDVPSPVGLTFALEDVPANLSELQVVSASASALSLDAGVDPPADGGFEVRRSDAYFGSATTTDLVLTSPVRGFSIPRLAFQERFFVRMFDGATPRRYSRVSSVVMTSLPVG